DFWIGADHAVVQKRQKPGGAVAAANTDDGLDLRVGEHLHHVRGALAVGAGEKPPAFAGIGSQLRFEAQPFEDGYRAVNVLRVGRCARGRNDSDGVSGVQSVWLDRHPAFVLARAILRKKNPLNKQINRASVQREVESWSG